MSDIVGLGDANNVPFTLRKMAKDIESGKIVLGDAGLTIVAPPNVFQLGYVASPNEAVMKSIMNLSLGITKLNNSVLSSYQNYGGDDDQSP